MLGMGFFTAGQNLGILDRLIFIFFLFLACPKDYDVELINLKNLYYALFF